jgi:hypothetical protein
MTDSEGNDYRRLLDERHKAVIDRLIDIHVDVRKQNGRVTELEAEVAVLKDRSPGRTGGIWGAAGGLIAGFATGWFKP